jgi:hypothetical protein
MEDQMANPFGDYAAAPDGNFGNEEARRAADAQRATRERQMQALHLQRENILSQRTSSPARRTALEAALAHVEAQIQSLG